MEESHSAVVKVIEAMKDDKQIKFFIKLIPKDRFVDAVNHMCTFFLADEPICKSLNVKNDPQAVEEFKALFKIALEDNLSVAAFVENPQGGKPIIAALNVLYLGGKGQKIDFSQYISKSDKVQRVMQVMEASAADVNFEKLYGCDKYIGGFGLSVDPVFRGNAIGYHLLMARNEVGKAKNIPLTMTVFTSPISAKLASRAGFQVLSEKLRDTLVDENGQLLVPACKTESFKCMGKDIK
ncbi:uncharacterized protein LOC122499199 [Leptopilina heterotoma]|uniref:uncharacterized protein LOC122499199 n=1 Tax=Leptopilina heterotoma TaxID=63436 RepID=UPI001CA94AC1|nr:uncharacterized protein LOC122499199 [Leptopilina heterotoma]